MLKRLFMLFEAIFMSGMLRVTLRSGATVTFRRPKGVTKNELTEEMQRWLAVDDNKPLKYTQWQRKMVLVRREEIAGVEVW